jgi:hypothetical protein
MYRIEWLQDALDELAAIWLRATAAERQLITAESHRVDQVLGVDPYGAGESRPRRQRVAFFLPLVVFYRVEQDDQTVTVLHIRFARGRS